MSPLFLLLLICLSLHACNARFLGLNNKETKKQIFNKVLVQYVDEMDLHRTTSVPISEILPPVSEEQGARRQQVVSKNIISLLVAATMNQKDVEANFVKQEEGKNGATSRNKVMVSSQADLQQASEIMEGDLKGQAAGRSMLGSTANDTEEAVQPEENGIEEDVVVMDYAQPHRKPPIHNEKP